MVASSSKHDDISEEQVKPRCEIEINSLIAEIIVRLSENCRASHVTKN